MAHVHSLSSASTASTKIALLLRAAATAAGLYPIERATEKCRMARNYVERKGERERGSEREREGTG